MSKGSDSGASEALNRLLHDKSNSTEFYRELQRSTRDKELMNNRLINEKKCVACRLTTGSVLGCVGLFYSYRTYCLWKYFDKKNKVLNFTVSGLLLSMSLLQYSVAFSEFTAKKQEDAFLTKFIRRNVTYYLMSHEEKKKFLLDLIEDEESKKLYKAKYEGK